jgi:hypothetical protein
MVGAALVWVKKINTARGQKKVSVVVLYNKMNTMRKDNVLLVDVIYLTLSRYFARAKE